MVARVFAKAKVTPGTRPFRYSFSGAGDPCLRTLCYDAQDADAGLPPAEGNRELSWILSSACGTAIGEVLERAGVALGGVSQQLAEFDTGGIKVRGSLDLAGRECVLDFKLVGEKKWAKVAKGPDDKHKLQVNGYAVATDRPRWGLVYIRAVSIFDGEHTTPELRIHEGEASVELAQQLCGVWEEVERHRSLRTLPERVWGASPHRWPCGWCRHANRCGPAEEE
jgi:hypothetical protein